MVYYGKHTKEIAAKIIEAFKHPEQLPKALAQIFIRRKDDVSCRRWSWHNQLITALSGSVDARGFRQWQKAGRKVKKGSKAIWILAPCTKKITAKNNEDDEQNDGLWLSFHPSIRC